MMQKRIRLGAILIILALSAALLAGCAKPPVVQVEGGDVPRDKTLTVQGTGSVMVEPDIARITVGALTSDADADAAQDQNDTVMTEMIEAIKGAGVDEKDIQTTQYNVRPRYDHSGKIARITGFEVTHMVTVVIRDIDTVGRVLKAANGAGANQSQNISFGVDDRDAVYREALTKAVENAKEKAQAMASPAGVSLKEPAAIYEGSVPMEYSVTRAYPEEASYDSASVPTQSGQLEIRAQVTVVYNMQ